MGGALDAGGRLGGEMTWFVRRRIRFVIDARVGVDLRACELRCEARRRPRPPACSFSAAAPRSAAGGQSTALLMSGRCHCIAASTRSGSSSAVEPSMIRARSSTILRVTPRIMRHTGPATAEKATSKTTSSERSRLCHRSGTRAPSTAGRLGIATRIANGALIGFAISLSRFERNSSVPSRKACQRRSATPSGPSITRAISGDTSGLEQTCKSPVNGGPGSWMLRMNSSVAGIASRIW
mmetsp:Transcript_15461/g.39225  ORF Transcript_15461/g.39225 Transcript_15461/m.39225 type:complete len:238 (-) Transcript_15461:517-1230(-)